MASSPAPGFARSTSDRAVRLLRSEYLVLLLCAAWFVAVLPVAPYFASTGNLTNILAAMLPLLVLATRQTLVLVTGGIDLSMTSTVALTSVIGGLVMNAETGWLAGHTLATPVGVIAMLMIGALVGAANGIAISLGRMPAFIVTLTMMMFVSGYAVWLTKSRPVSGLPASFNAIGGHVLLATVVAGGVLMLAHLALARTLFGRWLYAIGHNVRAATVSGVPVRTVTITVYIVAGVCAAFASIIYTGRLETASPVLAERMLLDVIGATVIGGTSLYGGRGKVLWTLFGVLFFTLIDNSLNLLGLSHFSIMMVKGGIILLAAGLDTMRHRTSSAA